MSQQHSQFEEEFRDGPQPGTSYQGQGGYTGPQPVSYTVNVPPLYSQVGMPGQKLLVQDLSNGRSPSAGQRLALAIVSLLSVFVAFIITLGIVAAFSQEGGFSPITPLAVFFALIFAVVVLILNLIFNRRH